MHTNELPNLLYGKVEKNQVLMIETIQQELYKPEKHEQMTLGEEHRCC